MSRLTHSSGGFIRCLQMSSARFFTFVEGGIDRTFVDRLATDVCTPLALRHQVVAVRELPGSAGGKIALLTVFRDLRRKRMLTSTAFGKRMVCAFFADKDSDDFSRTQLRSEHLFYTKTYDIEGHLYSCGDIQRALADASGLTLQQAKLIIPDQNLWLQDIEKKWRPWIGLCIISQVHRVNCGCTYDRPSAINIDPMGPTDFTSLEKFKARLCSALGTPRAHFDALFQSVDRRLSSAASAGSPLRYFKGKWLIHVLQRHVELSTKPADALTNSIGDKVTTALLAQVASHSACRCCTPFRPGLATLAAKIA